MTGNMAAFAAGVLMGVLALCGCAAPSAVESPTSTSPESVQSETDPFTKRMSALEDARAVTVGVSARSSHEDMVEYRADERFGYASTLKLFAAAALLAELSPDERAATTVWTKDDVDQAGYSPVTGEQLGGGLSLEQLAEAAVRESDNLAMNLIMESVGGPVAVERFLRTLGDDVTRVGAYEPDLNHMIPGQDTNTTTASAFTVALQTLMDGHQLSDSAKNVLKDWMSDNPTGDTLVRAGAPAGWVVADKSGGAGGVRNDVAVVSAPDGTTVLLTIFTATNDPDAQYDDEVVEEVTRLVMSEFD